MAVANVLAQVMSECSRIWAEMSDSIDPAGNGLASDSQSRFAEFALRIQAILEDLDGYANGTVNQALSQLNPFANPMHLHIHAAIPRLSDGNPQVAIPNQNNGNLSLDYITGQGRIHCLGLAGSYVPSAIVMTMKQYDQSENLTREIPGWSVPVCNNNQIPTPGSYGGHFNSAYCWISYGTNGGQPPSHCSGLYPYFERFGYCQRTHYTRFEVECQPEGRWWSAACVWESDQSHNLIRWRDE